MATEFPIDPSFNRFIDGITQMPDGSAVVDMPDEEPPEIHPMYLDELKRNGVKSEISVVEE